MSQRNYPTFESTKLFKMIYKNGVENLNKSTLKEIKL